MSTLDADQPPVPKRSRTSVTAHEKKAEAKTVEAKTAEAKPPVIVDEFTYVAQSTIPGAGWGLFAKKRLRKNLNIGYYKGKVFRRYPSWKNKEKHRDFVYFMELDRRPPWIDKKVWSAKKHKYVYVDGTSIHSFANCCKDDEDLWNCDVRGTGAFVTNKVVEKDEEIFICYGKDYWESDLRGSDDDEEEEEEGEEGPD